MLPSNPSLLLRPFKAIVAGNIALNYIGTVTPSIASLVATASSASIGTASADRLVVVALSNNFSNLSLASISMTADSGGGNVAMTQNGFTGQNGSTTGLYSLVVPSNTTATFIATATAGSWGGVRFHVYTVTGWSSSTATGQGSNGATATNVSTNIATTSGGVIIAAIETQSTFTNFTGSTETFSFNAGSGATHGAGSATGIATNASSTVTINSGGSASIAVTAAAWR